MAVLTACGAFGYAIATANQAVVGPAIAKAAGYMVSIDFDFGGPGLISGHTKIQQPNGQLAIVPNGRVILHVRSNGLPLKQTFSDANGYYEFKYINKALTYYVVFFDSTLQNNAAIADYISPI